MSPLVGIAYERALFGDQGGGRLALLADPAVREQVQALNQEMNSSEFKNRDGGFMENCNSQVTALYGEVVPSFSETSED